MPEDEQLSELLELAAALDPEQLDKLLAEATELAKQNKE